MKETIAALHQNVDAFLEKWTNKMREAGYLQSTTAKREDCVLSLSWFLEPLLAEAENERDFADLVLSGPRWADKILQTARRHRFRGVTADMFVGCFKTLVQAVEECLMELDQPLENRIRALMAIRKYADAYETIIVADWTALTQQEDKERLDEANRTLTLTKNKFENILAAISDLVLLVDKNGFIMEYNRAAEKFFGPSDPTEKEIWDVLELEARDMDEFLRYYSVSQSHEISALNETCFFELKIIPLKVVSLASDAYLIVLNDVTCHVQRRETLEDMVRQRSAALEQEKLQLEEMNITLRNVMVTINKEIESYKNGVAHTIKTVLLPALDKVQKAQSRIVQKGYLDILEDQLFNLSTLSGGQRDPLLLKLTPMEMKVCRFIKAGTSTKGISETLNLSLGTIQTHRKNIRRKLKLQNRQVSLYNYLINHGF